MKVSNYVTMAIIAAALSGTPALAQIDQRGHDQHAQQTEQPVNNGMMAGMEKMSKDMAAVPMTGNTDRDFAAMMIPHHQGAIDMAQAELRQGKDPTMRRLAHDVIAAQKREIAMMQRWLATHR